MMTRFAFLLGVLSKVDNFQVPAVGVLEGGLMEEFTCLTIADY